MFVGPAILALLLASSCKKENLNNAGKSKPDPRATKILRFSAIPDENTTEQTVKFKKFAVYLSKKLGVTTQFIPTTDYASAVDKFVNGEIHLAWFGGLTGVQAINEVKGARAIAQGIEDLKYISYFIANSDTGLELSESFPAKIKDLKFTFGSEKSTSGRLMPSFFIQKETGIAAEKWFSLPVGFSGAHDKTAKLVESGAFEVGALSYKKYDSMVESGKLNKEKCKIIWKTPPYADYNWTAHPELDQIYGEGFIDKVQEALIEISDDQLLLALTRSKIIPAKNEDFQGIADIAKKLGLLNN
ncbi:MAG TPA: putative selenate ABC transporter substrate-binding protein [Verrucomicrobia bacterium]|nr:putative selenate ABC transporter substrate-binding protein [Verrucomicrobiales bacterium]HIL53676.1 putative selenate ABC transporter substrate-binding protein [Verrucomicrobiota bacterium]